MPQSPSQPLVRSFPTSGALGLALESQSQEVQPGQVLSYDLVVGNQQAAPLTTIDVRDRLPEGLLYLPGNPASLRYDDATREVIWEVAALQPGEVLTATFQVRLVGNTQAALIHQAQASASGQETTHAWSAIPVGRVVPNQKWITPQGGALTAHGKPLTLRLPAQAVASPVQVRLTPAPAQLPTLENQLDSFVIDLLGEAGDTPGTLAQPMLLTLEMAPYHEQLRSQQGTPTFFRLDEQSGEWKMIPSRMEWGRMQLTARSDQPGTFAVASSTQQFSYGAQHLPTMHGFTSDEFSGNSSFGYPLVTPPGPGGLGVNLSLSYSSENVNAILAGRQDRYKAGLDNFDRQAGIAGWGWNLNGLGQITYDHDEGTYSLNYGGGSFKLLKPEETQGNGWQTTPQSFLKIEHDPAGPTWTVWGTDGTKYIFGDPTPSDGVQEGVAFTAIMEYVGGYAQCRKEVREAQLTRIIDPLGNQVRFTYGREWRQVVNCVYDTAIYPQRIEYVPAGQSTSTAQIVFGYGPRTDLNVGPWDKTYFIYFRYDQRLDSIAMQVRNSAGGFDTARTYRLRHDFDLFDSNDSSRAIMRLVGIREYGRDGTALPEWTFRYARQTTTNPLVGGVPETTSARANLNLLTEANNGQGGTVRYNYALVTGIPYVAPAGNSCPGQGYTARYRVSSMELHDGLGNMTRTDYASSNARAWTDEQYEQGCQGRFEFGGYGVVTRSLVQGSTVLQKVESRYHQETEAEWVLTSWRADDLVAPYSEFAPAKGKVWLQRTLSPTGVEFVRANSSWAIQENAQTRHSPWVYKESDVSMLENSAQQLTTYEYRPTHQGGTQYGNLTHIWQYRDGGSNLYRLTEHWFFPNPTTNITQNLARQKLWEYQAGNLLCKGDSVQLYDSQAWNVPPTRGKLSLQQVAQSACNGTWSETAYSYDQWGNPTSVRDPRGYTTTTAYDTLLHIFPVSVTTPPVAAGQFTTRYEWDLTLGQVTGVIDPNNQRTSYSYDGLGRLVEMWQPLHNNRVGAGTQKFEYVNYSGPTSPMRVLQRQRLDVGADLTTPAVYQDSHTFYNGMGQVVQTRSASPSSKDYDVISLTRYNAMGQASEVYVPIQVGATSALIYHGPTSTVWGSAPAKTRTEYDALGRPTAEIAPNGARTEHRYGLVNDGGALLQWHDVLDANRHRTQYRTDLLGRMVQVVEISGDCASYWGYSCAGSFTTPWAAHTTTRYGYDVADRLTSVIDAANHLTTINYDLQGRKTSMKDPDMGTWSYSYDAAGNLTRQTDARTCQVSFGYDALGRQTTKSYSGPGACATTSPVTYYYDNVPAGNTARGQRTQMSDGTGSTIWRYDARGRVIQEQKTIKDAANAPYTFVTNWSYDSVNRVRTTDYPSAGVGGSERITHEYDSDRQLLLTRMSGALNGVTTVYAQGLAYNAYGQLTSLQYGTVRTQTYQYYPLTAANGGLLQSSEVVGLRKMGYSYDAIGNVLSITDYSDGQVQRFGYDHRDRLISAEATGGTKGPFARETYAYDLLGNLNGQGGTSYSYTGSDCSTASYSPHAVHEATAGNTATQYCYDQSGNLTQRVTSVSSGGGGGSETMVAGPDTQGTTSESDAAPSAIIPPPDGTTSTTRTFTYDGENRLISVSDTSGLMPQTSMAYDGDGNRVRLTEGGTSTLYVGSHYEYTLASGSATATRYYYMGGQRIALRKGTAAPEWLVGDHLGSTNLTLNNNGTLKAELRYKPWGQLRYESGSTATQRRYTGQIQDAGTGLYFYNARYYDPAMGKFTQPDTLVPRPGNPQSFNRYAYTLNNPIKYTDPTGHDVMLIGGYGSGDWENPETWKWWIMAYKGWTSDSQWNENFYDGWMAATRAGDDAAKQAIMKREGVHIFNWSACGCGATEKDSSRNASIEWGMSALEEQMEGMEDITMVGHSKGGNLVLNYISDPGHKHNIKNAITAGSPLHLTAVWLAPVSGVKGQLINPLLNESARRSNVVILNHVADLVTALGTRQTIGGATYRKYMFFTGDAHAFHRNPGVAKNALTVDASVVGDRNARTR